MLLPQTFCWGGYGSGASLDNHVKTSKSRVKCPIILSFIRYLTRVDRRFFRFNKPLFTIAPKNTHKRLLLGAGCYGAAGRRRVLCEISAADSKWRKLPDMQSTVCLTTPFTFHSEPASSAGQLRDSRAKKKKRKNKRANGGAFLPEPATKDLKQGHVMQDITLSSAASL